VRRPPREAPELEPEILVLLGAVAFATAILSAIVGMAGGIVLLATMLLFLPPLEAIPLHGAIQLVSNGSRTWIQRRNVRWEILGWTSLLMVPAGVLGLMVARNLPEAGLRAAIGVFVLLATWLPGAMLLGTHPEEARPRRRFILLGGVSGFLGPAIGAVGPLLAPFFLNLGLTRQALVGTKAATQSAGHLVKIALYGGFGFAFAPWLPLLAVCAACVTAGTWVGSHILDRVSERAFVVLYKVVLTLIALRLLLGELL